jgi:single-strand DNA-binding protein
MQDLNSFNVIGRLTRDVGSDPNGRDYGYLQNGTCKAEISIANNRSKKQGEQWVDDVSYFTVTIFGKMAENLKPYLTKGTQVCVSAHLHQDRWTDKEGKNQSRISIIADSVQLIGGKKEEGFNPNKTYPTAQAAQKASSYAQQYQNQQNSQQNFNGQPFQEDIPSGGDDYPSDIPF